MWNFGVVALAALLIALPAADASCSPRENPWTIVKVRERRAGEVPFEETSRYLQPSPDANNVRGPDSLVARVRSDENLHPHIEIQDLRTGRTTPLFAANACCPEWSPDGKYIACAVWKSPRQNGELTVVGVAARTMILDPEVKASATTFKWSPDSRMLAAQGTIYGSPRTMLYAVSVPGGKTVVLDTVDVLTDYEFSWSPNGHWMVFSRPTTLDDDENPTAADLWVADPETGTTWCVLETPDWVELDPLWITDSTILVDRVHWDGTHRGIEQRVVIELSKAKSPKMPD